MYNGTGQTGQILGGAAQTMTSPPTPAAKPVALSFSDNDKAINYLEALVGELELRLADLTYSKNNDKVPVDLRGPLQAEGSHLVNCLNKNTNRIGDVNYRLQRLLASLEL